MKTFELFALFIKWDVSAGMGSNKIDRRIFQIQIRSLKKYQIQILLPNTICLEMSASESALFIIIIILLLIIFFIYRGLLIELSLICYEALIKMVHNVQNNISYKHILVIK